MLSGGNDEGAFTLSSSGQLSLTETPDREVREKYVLLITATDSGTSAPRLRAAPIGGVTFRLTALQCQLFTSALVPHMFMGSCMMCFMQWNVSLQSAYETRLERILS